MAHSRSILLGRAHAALYRRDTRSAPRRDGDHDRLLYVPGSRVSACLPERVRNCDVKCLKDPLPNGWAETRDAELRRLVNPMQMAIGNMEYGYKACGRVRPTAKPGFGVELNPDYLVPHLP